MTRFCNICIVDEAVSPNELHMWSGLAMSRAGVESQPLVSGDYAETELYSLAKTWATGPLIHVLLFEVTAGSETERHRDVGEWAVCFYPESCPTGPLWTEYGEVAVVRNRAVSFDATVIEHRQITPSDGTARRSIVFKFRRAA